MFECDCLLNATGRVPNVFGAGLDEAGVDYNNRQGVVIDDFFRFVVVICLLSLSLSPSLPPLSLPPSLPMVALVSCLFYRVSAALKCAAHHFGDEE